jgi:hypothetical protein
MRETQENSETIEGIAELDELLSSLEPPGFEPTEAEPAVGARPEPVGYVTRELQGPDGSLVRVEVPVYAASEGQAPDEEPAQAERDPDAPPATEDLDELLAAEDADD